MRIGLVGAGLGGLATAALLARAGHAVELLERAPEPRPVGAGLLLQPPGQQVLARLGVLGQVAASGARVTRLHATTPGGRTLLRLDYGDLAPGLHGLGLARPAIWQALRDACAAAGASLHAGCEVQALRQDATGAEAVLPGGEARRYDLLVLAAGAHTALWPARRAAPYAWGCLWATLALPADWPEDVLQQRCRGTAEMAGVLPLGGGQAALYWSIRNDQVAAWRAKPIEAWQAQVAALWPALAPLLAGLRHADLSHASYSDVWADPPHDGRLLVLGDAAHGTSPQLGQGTTQAFRDALALTAALAEDAPLAAQLAGYWAGRRARTRYYRWASRALTPVFQGGPAWLGWLRDAGAGLAHALPPLRRQALLTLAGAKAGWLGAEPPAAQTLAPADGAR